MRAVAGFDATFSAPKSLSVWWALTGDPGLLEAHDIAVTAALAHLERYGATTRIRHQGRRLHPDTAGLAMATFRQTTSRADDPQLHTHAVISAKVQTLDGRWRALDARFLKRHQRMLGGLYQSVLRAELTHRYGITWAPIVNGQAEIAGIPGELLEVFSKRTVQVDAALADTIEQFRAREGRDPTRWERAAMTREAAADSRGRKTGTSTVDLRARWQGEAGELGWTAERLVEGLTVPAHEHQNRSPVTVEQIFDHLSTVGSTWTRADVMRAVCDLAPPVSDISGQQWAAALDRVTGEVLGQCVNLDPNSTATRRVSDGRSVWLEPTSPHYTSPAILAEEERILTWSMEAQVPDPTPSATVDRDGLDILQADAAAAVAGDDRLVVVVGPAGTGKTTMLRAAMDDLRRHGRTVFGVAPTAKAAHVLADETGMEADTVAKLLHEWTWHDRLPDRRYQLPTGTTLVIDEAGMLGTSSLHHLTRLADHLDWRLVLVGDPRQLQAVGRGGLFAELCTTSRSHELVRIHRFTHPWEAAASLQLRAGDPDAIAIYETHGRITPGVLDAHLAGIAQDWLTLTAAGRTVAITASSNQHVDALNNTIQHARLHAGHMDPAIAVPIGSGERAHVGEIVVTRRNDRNLTTSSGETVRNREQWLVTAIHREGALAVEKVDGRGTVILPADYVAQHLRLGYAATEHGHQGDTVDVGIALASAATTHRGLYVATTRGRHDNRIHVITETDDLSEARDVIEGVLTHDWADIPAVAQRRYLAHSDGSPPRAEADPLLPDWVQPWRQRLDDRRQQLIDGLTDRQDRRTATRHELRRAPAPARCRSDKRGSPTPDPSATSNSGWTASSARPCGKPTVRPAPPASVTGAPHNATPPRPRKRSTTPKLPSPPSGPTAHHTRKTSIASRSAPATFKPMPICPSGSTSTTANRSLSSTRSSTQPTPTPPGSTDARHPPRDWLTPSPRSHKWRNTHPRSPPRRTPSTRPAGTNSSTWHPTTSHIESHTSARWPRSSSAGRPAQVEWSPTDCLNGYRRGADWKKIGNRFRQRGEGLRRRARSADPAR